MRFHEPTCPLDTWSLFRSSHHRFAVRCRPGGLSPASAHDCPARRATGATTPPLLHGTDGQLKTEGQTPHERGLVAWSHELVTRGATFSLGAFRTQQMTKSRRAANQFSGAGQLEALRHRLLSFQHRGTSNRARSSQTPRTRENGGPPLDPWLKRPRIKRSLSGFGAGIQRVGDRHATNSSRSRARSINASFWCWPINSSNTWLIII